MLRKRACSPIELQPHSDAFIVAVCLIFVSLT
jgi:hypothetical protein